MTINSYLSTAEVQGNASTLAKESCSVFVYKLTGTQIHVIIDCKTSQVTT